MNTTYFLNLTAGNLFGTKTSPAVPAKYYLGLSTTAPNLDGTGVNEPSSAGAYARVELDNLSEPKNGVVTNADTIDFAESTTNWGTISHYVIYDSLVDGNLLMFGELSTPRGVEPATVMTIKKDYLKLSVQNPA